MNVPKNVNLFETKRSITWIDENGIICSKSKKAPPSTIEEAKKEFENFRKRFGDKKFCMLLDITNSSPNIKEIRDYTAAELSKMLKALAMLSNSALGNMMANLFFGLKPPQFPTKMFTDECEAKEWLKQYL